MKKALPSLGLEPVFSSMTGLIIYLLAAGVAQASQDLWNGGGAPDGSWQNPNNWGGTAPVAGDYLFFDTSNQLLATNDYPAGTSFANLTFNSTAGSFDLGGNSLMLAAPGQDVAGNFNGGSITNLAAVPETNSESLVLAEGFHRFINAGSSQLYLAGTNTWDADATLAVATNGGAIVLSGLGMTNDASANGGILGGWSVIGVANNQGDWAALNAAGATTACTGYTTFSGGTSFGGTQAGKNVKITSRSSSNNTLNGSTAGTYDMNTLLWNIGNSNPSGNQSLSISSGQVLRLGTNGGIMNVHGNSRTFIIGNGSSGVLTAGGPNANTPGELTLVQLNANGGQVQIDATLEDNGTGSVTVNEIGSVNYNFANSYSGGTHLEYGEAYLQGGASFGSGPIYVHPGARADFGGNNGITCTNNFFISGMGFVSANQPGCIKGTYTGKFTGTFTLTGNAWIDPNAGSASCTFAGPFTGTGSLSIGGPAGSYVEGTAVFGANCNYTGDTVVDATANNNGGATIQIAAGTNDIMNNGGDLVLVGGSTGLATFDLNGTTQTINGLDATNGIPENAYIKSSVAGGVLVVGNNNISSTYYGNLENGGGTLGLTKIGTGAIAVDWMNTYTGPTTVSNGVLSIGYSLASSQILVVNPGLLDVSALGTYTLGSGQTLTGNGAVNGSVSAGSASTINPGIGPGVLTISNNLTLNSGSTTIFNLSTTTNGANNQLVVGGGLNLNGGTIQINAASLQVARYRLILYSGSESGSAANNLALSYAGDQSISLDDSIPGQIDLVVSSALVSQLTWQGDNSQNAWDIGTTANWLIGSTPSVYTNATAVIFNDAGSKTPPVNLSTTVQPSSLLVSNNTGAYTFSGNGNLTGGMALTKQGAGALVLNDTGGDNFSGGISALGGSLVFSNANMNLSGGLIVSNSVVDLDNYGALSGNLTVQNGGSVLLDQSPGSTFAGNAGISNNAAVQLGQNDSGGVLPAGNLLVNGTLTFDQNVNDNVGNQIFGSGTLVQANATILTLGATNSFAGNMIVQSGTLQGWTKSSLGSTVGSITVSNGATLDHGSDTTKAIIVSGAGVGGNGALVNNSSADPVYDGAGGGLTTSLTLTGNTIFGGSTRWDLGYPCVLSCNGSNYNLVINQASGTYMEWEDVNIDTNLGNIDIETPGGGSLGIKGSGESLGNPTNTITVWTNSALTFWGFGTNDSGYAKNIHVLNGGTVSFRPQNSNVYYNTTVTFEDGSSWDMFNGSGSIGTALLQPIQLNGLVHLQVGDSTCTVSNVISGPGGFYWDDYNNVLVFTATNTYRGITDLRAGMNLVLSGNGSISGSTNISLTGNATVTVTNRVDGALTLANNQVLSGVGKVSGMLVAGAGSTVAPGTNGYTATLTVSSNATLNGNAVFKLNGLTSDELSVGGALTFGGTLTLTNISGTALAAGDSFQLFNAGAYAGAFTAISPATPGAGLVWNTGNLAGNGTLAVSPASGPVITGLNVSGATLTLMATNGLAASSVVLLESTNVVLPLAQWTPVLTNQYDSNGNLNLSTNIINPGNPQEFFILSQ